MSNLGPYQEITTAAKKAGGVVKWIGAIEKNAVSEATPRLLTKGGLTGSALTLVVGGAGYAGKRYLDKRKADQAAADEAKRQLKAEFGDDEPEPGGDD